jgi:hypothetical protein
LPETILVSENLIFASFRFHNAFFISIMISSVALDFPVRILGAFVALALAPILLLAEKYLELRLALAALICRIQVQRCVMGPYVLVYQVINRRESQHCAGIANFLNGFSCRLQSGFLA